MAGQTTKNSAPRARDKRASHAEQARRVDVITNLMQRGDWKAEMAEQFAAEWNVSVSMVQQLSAEASRRHEFVLGLMKDPAKLADEAATMLVRTMHRSYERNNADGVIRAADVVTKIKGARAPEKSEVTVTARELESLPPVALLARIDDQISKLTDARKKLLEEHPELGPKFTEKSPCRRADGVGTTSPTAHFFEAYGLTQMKCGRCEGIADRPMYDAVEVTHDDGTKTLHTSRGATGSTVAFDSADPGSNPRATTNDEDESE